MFLHILLKILVIVLNENKSYMSHKVVTGKQTTAETHI